MTAFFSRVRIRAEAGAHVLRPLASGHYGLHQLLWQLYPDNSSFLFREADLGQFLVVSTNAPDPARFKRPVFDIESKPYDPKLRPGEALTFHLRACAAVCREGKRHDIVQDARKRGDARPRLEIAQDVGTAWLARKGHAHGFELLHATVDGYEQHRAIQQSSGREVQFSTLDFSGILRVLNPSALNQALTHGIGRAKAFGAGLMLVRRVS
jgi:CRISPR system Cascade subunit CasE